MASGAREAKEVIIVGAGIAGLHVGIELLKRDISCCILEAYHIAGGRVFTFKTNVAGKVQWESGAGRISLAHKRVLGLLKRYGLHTYPMSGESLFVDGASTENHFSELCGSYMAPLRALSPSILQTHTLSELLESVLGTTKAKHFYEMFPYWSEVHTARADQALRVFEHEMKSLSGFVGCAEGLSALIQAMVRDFKGRGGTIRYDTKVTCVSSEDGTICLKAINTSDKSDTHDANKEYSCNRCILALPSEAIKRIRGVNLPVLKHLQMNPLLRIYAVFPVSKGAWFAGLPKVVTPGRIRFMIPIDESKGVIMISYTDGKDTQFWKRVDVVQDELMKQVRAMFPDRDIPDPLFFKMHYWKEGCTYWKPGAYDVADASKASVHPQKNMFICSESFAEVPCWMESSLIQADKVLKAFSA
jgi:monoamine oxidase